MRLCCDEAATETTEDARAVMEDDTKTPRLVKMDANYESAVMKLRRRQKCGTAIETKRRTHRRMRI